MAEEENNPNEENATGEGEEGEEGEAAPKKGNKMLIIIIAAGVILGLLIGVFVFLFLGGEDEPNPDELIDPVAELAAVAFVEMPDMTANFLASNGLGRRVKLKVTLEIAAETDVPLVEQLMPRIVDDMQTFVRQLRISDIQGSAGTLRLKEGLLRRAQQSAAPAQINNVLFKEITIN